ncbi:hypothetical protein OROHE_021048 [Orobanche hederae]
MWMNSEDDEGDIDEHMLESMSRNRRNGNIGESSNVSTIRNWSGGRVISAPNKRG